MARQTGFVLCGVGANHEWDESGRGEPRIDTDEKERSAAAEARQRIENGLSIHERARFQQACRTLFAVTVVEASSDAAHVEAAVVRQFNGKSAAEIVAAYDALDPAALMQAGQAGRFGSPRLQLRPVENRPTGNRP